MEILSQKKSHFTLEPPSKATWESHSEIMLMLASSKHSWPALHCLRLKSVTVTCLEADRSRRKQHIYPKWTEKIHFFDHSKYFGGKKNPKPNEIKTRIPLLPSPLTIPTKITNPCLSPSQKNPQNTSYQGVLLISGLQAIRRIFQAPKL